MCDIKGVLLHMLCAIEHIALVMIIITDFGSESHACAMIMLCNIMIMYLNS